MCECSWNVEDVHENSSRIQVLKFSCFSLSVLVRSLRLCLSLCVFAFKPVRRVRSELHERRAPLAAPVLLRSDAQFKPVFDSRSGRRHRLPLCSIFPASFTQRRWDGSTHSRPEVVFKTSGPVVYFPPSPLLMLSFISVCRWMEATEDVCGLAETHSCPVTAAASPSIKTQARGFIFCCTLNNH